MVRGFAPRIAAAVAALIASTAATERARPIQIARIGSTIDEAEGVGTKRAGTLCLPNGTIRWGDVGAGDAMDQRAVVEDAFEDTGLPVTPLGIAPDHAARLRGTVRAASFSLCARHWLGDGRRRLSGETTLRVEWRLETADGGPPLVHVSAVSRSVDARHAAPLGSLYRALLVDAATDAATWLRAN